MMIRTFLILTLVLPAAPLAAQQRPSPEQMKAMAEKMQPGSEHRELAALEGRWTQEITYNMGGAPIKVQGAATNRMILGGRFLVSERTAQSAAGGPMGGLKLDAMSIYGFDRRTNQYTMLELDTMGTY